ncbi:hypothetical protein GGS23DRAFT_194804 [Durotheca rogersii]|uniref:uncharacterized protein n=1 Tax=Durotheca rogersii TaxID=419775 RepID=UPI002221253C|nr:uncharacterized protein GGS23DRAFT_194804 [Durotheca rogersii]KAI5867777.1 hypothetical protein GGS23DRAFT_194804 [Durotheca rogersii]
MPCYGSGCLRRMAVHWYTAKRYWEPVPRARGRAAILTFPSRSRRSLVCYSAAKRANLEKVVFLAVRLNSLYCRLAFVPARIVSCCCASSVLHILLVGLLQVRRVNGWLEEQCQRGYLGKRLDGVASTWIRTRRNPGSSPFFSSPTPPLSLSLSLMMVMMISTCGMR